jgi:hypothetical protein
MRPEETPLTPQQDIPADAWQVAQDMRAGRVTSVEVVTRSLARP